MQPPAKLSAVSFTASMRGCAHEEKQDLGGKALQVSCSLLQFVEKACGKGFSMEMAPDKSQSVESLQSTPQIHTICTILTTVLSFFTFVVKGNQIC